jgi:hypothetical protein
MTTQQLERPLSEIDETAERIQASTSEPWKPHDEPAPWDMDRIGNRIGRVLRDPRALTIAALVAASVVVLATLIWGRRTPPRSTEDLLLERSRETLERAREALEAMASKVAALER